MQKIRALWSLLTSKEYLLLIPNYKNNEATIMGELDGPAIGYRLSYLSLCEYDKLVHQEAQRQIDDADAELGVQLVQQILNNHR